MVPEFSNLFDLNIFLTEVQVSAGESAIEDQFSGRWFCTYYVRLNSMPWNHLLLRILLPPAFLLSEASCFVKSIQIRSLSGPYSPVFRLITGMIRSIGKDEEYLSVFSLNVGKYGTEKLRIRALVTQFHALVLSLYIITFMLIFLYRKEKKVYKTSCSYKNQDCNTFKRYNNQIIDLN